VLVFILVVCGAHIGYELYLYLYGSTYGTTTLVIKYKASSTIKAQQRKFKVINKIKAGFLFPKIVLLQIRE
jgi:hypothetical protein